MAMDLRQFLPMFLSEVDEHLERMEQGFLSLETAAGTEGISELFRSAHTLKGAAGSMGYGRMADLTHRMETVLDQIRNGRRTPTSEIVDRFLAGVDVLKSLRREIADAGQEKTDVADLVAAFERFAAEPTPGASAPPAPTQKTRPRKARDTKRAKRSAAAGLVLGDAEYAAIAAGREQGMAAYRVHLRLSDQCLMKGPRLMIALRELEQEASIVAMRPTAEEVEREAFDFDVDCVVLSTRDRDAVASLLDGTPDMASIVVTPVDLSGDGTSPAPTDAPEPAGARAAAPAEPRLTGGGDADGATPAPADPIKKAADGAPAKQTIQTIRVDVDRLDNLVNLVGELVIDRIRLVQIVEQLRTGADLASTTSSLEEASHHLSRVTTDLQAQLMKARMLPIEHLFSRFPRLVRDLARKAGKQVDLVLEGQETELDRSVIEQIGDPLIHLVRNAVDHGIEAPDARTSRGKPSTGTVRLSASQEESSILVSVAEDGAGIDADRVRQKAITMGLITAEQAAAMPDAEAVELIFAAGLSTAKEVSDVSGRGVGMDIVRANLNAIGGTIQVETEKGKGTRFVLRLPLTLAILRALLVQCGEETFALPLSAIYETIEIPRNQVRSVAGEDATVLRGALLPLVSLSTLLGIDAAGDQETRLCIVVGHGHKRAGLLVDRVVREQEVVIKPLGPFVGEVPGVSGATILGDGRVALILDVSALLRRASRRKELSYVG